MKAPERFWSVSPTIRPFAGLAGSIEAKLERLVSSQAAKTDRNKAGGGGGGLEERERESQGDQDGKGTVAGEGNLKVK